MRFFPFPAHGDPFFAFSEQRPRRSWVVVDDVTEIIVGFGRHFLGRGPRGDFFGRDENPLIIARLLEFFRISFHFGEHRVVSKCPDSQGKGPSHREIVTGFPPGFFDFWAIFFTLFQQSEQAIQAEIEIGNRFLSLGQFLSQDRVIIRSEIKSGHRDAQHFTPLRFADDSSTGLNQRCLRLILPEIVFKDRNRTVIRGIIPHDCGVEPMLAPSVIRNEIKPVCFGAQSR